ncbi:MAG: septal ring lytic transglycosylase RlpA family protein [Alphaproteobacteria bacterium]|nr:septal ring lytic transglycosylase RlpA family protein [Alphaproteobacteria bacterium]
MRTILVALVALLTFGMVSAQAASGKWKCHGPSYACNGNAYNAAKKNTYRKKSASNKSAYKKKGYSNKGYSKGYSAKKRTAKHAYGKQKYSKKKSYSKNRYSGGGTLYGKASYYWQPQAVASGGRFNPNAMTAAHKTLPFGTKVRVTNKHNGRSVVVRINDRGPYIKGRIIDLSKAAAYKIGMQNAGVVAVSVTILGRG